MNYRLFSLGVSIALFTISSLLAQTADDCGSFRTQTQGGWGASAQGENPGAYRDANFVEAFPDGVTIGCDESLHFTTSEAIEIFLPCGGTPSTLTNSATDLERLDNVLAGQILALSLSLGFDAADPSFSASEIPLSSLIIAEGEFAGFTLEEILIIANRVLGSCESNYSPSQINSLISAINENFVDGTMDDGFLKCPDDPVEELFCELDLTSLSSSCINETQYVVQLSISGVNGAFILLSQNAVTGNAQSFCFDNTTTSLDFELVFDLHDNYQFEVISDEGSDCTVSTSNDCSIEWTTGPPPSCCQLSVECPWNDVIELDCVSSIPHADPDAIIVTESCDPVSITFVETQSGNGCFSAPLLLTRVYSITDGTNTHTCIEQYQVIDDVAPVIECPSDEIVSCSTGSLFPTDWAVATDNCDDAVTVFYIDLPSPSCEGFLRRWNARDDCNNIATCDQTILFTDDTPPMLFVPQDKEIDCLSTTDPSFTGQATANDICSEVFLTHTDSVSTVNECTSEIYRTWIATDACGNSVSDVQLITQTDMTGPVISNLPPGTTMQCGEVPPPDDPIAVDACSGDTLEVSLEEIIQDDGCQMIFRRIYTAIDDCDNATTRIRIITISDTQAPVMNCPSDVTLSCGDLDYTPVITGAPEAIDNCSGTSVSISYQDSELNLNTCPPEIQRQWSATDECGNIANCIQYIYFEDTTIPTMDCPSDISISCSGDVNLDPTYTGTATGSDECSATTLSYIDGPMTGSCPMTFARTWTVSDACSNSVSCTQMITMTDTVAPIIICPDEISVNCSYSIPDPSVSGSPTIDGECLAVTLEYTDSELTSECPKVFTRTWTATDVCGNSSECIQQITLFDIMNPVVFCPADTTLTCDSDLSPALIGEATTIDYCSDVDVTYSDVQLDDGCSAYIERSWVAVDACGNSQVCVQTIHLSPTEAISVLCPNDINVSTMDDAIPEVTGYPEVDADCASVVSVYNDVITTIGPDTLGEESCGSLRTQTQGGWGTIAHGDNPGVYRDAHFDQAFPNGLTVGCNHELTLTSSTAVQRLLPCGGTPATLSDDLVDPTSLQNVLAGQLIALTLSVNFDLSDPDFGDSNVDLGDMTIGFGSFEGWTVFEVLEEANAVFGDCMSEYSASEMVQVLSSINENYVGGTMNNGFLDCPGDTEHQTGQIIILRTWTIISACQDTTYCEQIITVDDSNSANDGAMSLLVYPSPTSGNLMIEFPETQSEGGILYVYDMQGNLFLTLPKAVIETEYSLDLSSLDPGMYMVLWVSQGRTSSAQIIKY